MKENLELRLAPDWDTVKGTWDACMKHFASLGLSDDESYALSMTAQELLENGVKYGLFDAAMPRLELCIQAARDNVTISVKSPVTTDLTRLEALDKTVQWIRGFQDPFEAYVERMKQVAAQPMADRESGLGLVRVAYEARCILDFFVDERNVLSISAVYPTTEALH